MEEKLVSVIIPTYNRGDLISETIVSVLNQTYQNFEIFIIDDGSIDNTKVLVQSFNDERVRYIFQEHSGLPASGRNTGIKHAIGDYIAFLDSDDLWYPQKLEIQINMLKKYPNILLISTNGVYFPSKLDIKVLPIKNDTEITFRYLLENNIIINSSVLMRKKVTDKIGLLDEDNKLKYGEDYDYWLRLLKYKDNSILILKNILVKYRNTTNDLINLYRNPQFFLQKYRIISHISEKHKDINNGRFKEKLRKLLYNYKISKEIGEIVKKKHTVFEILKNKSIKVDKKLFFLIEYLFSNFKLINFMKKARIFRNKKDYLKILLYKLLR